MMATAETIPAQIQPAEVPVARPDAAPTVDVCGKRTLDYVIECLAYLNRNPNDRTIVVRGVGANTSRVMSVCQILLNEFDCEVVSSQVIPLQVNRNRVLCSAIGIKAPTVGRRPPTPADSLHKNGLVEFPIYSLLFDALLHNHGELRIDQGERRPLITIRSGPDIGFTAKPTNSSPAPAREELERISAAYYRSGMVLSPSWELVAETLSQFDDIIIGVDTNILYTTTLSEQILSSLFLNDPRAYVHTPNWVLLVIPNAVIHELEQAANLRNEKGRLTAVGRVAYRALEEIVELNNSADIAGVSLMVAGAADPAMDARVELRKLREDLVMQRDRDLPARPGQQAPKKPPKSSSGDMIIRAQYREFLRQIDFHKGTFFLTADKSNAALARAEGLHSIYYKTPTYEAALKEVGPHLIPCIPSEDSIRMAVPLGNLVYELAVQFGSIRIAWGKQKVEVHCDEKGESLDHWLRRALLIEPPHIKTLLNVYERRDRCSLSHVRRVWGGIMEDLLGGDVA